MKYSIRMDFDTEVGRDQLRKQGDTTAWTIDEIEVEIDKLTDESHMKGMLAEIEEYFGVPNTDAGVAGFVNVELVLED